LQEERTHLLSKVEQKLNEELVKFEEKFEYPVNPAFMLP